MEKASAFGENPVHDEDFWNALRALRRHIERERFKGFDPYDGLNTPFPVSKLGKWPAILFMQAMKRFPVNMRPVLGIRKAHNPKAIGLLLHAYSKLYTLRPSPELRVTMDELFEWLLKNQSKGYAGPAWGYNFDWAGKAKTVRAYTPTAVVTGFVVRGLYCYHGVTGSVVAREIIEGAADFILKDLHHDESDAGLCISYTPLIMDYCYNASLLGAGVLAMGSSLNGNEEWSAAAQRAARFVLSHQHSDGRWNYSIDPVTGREREQIDFHQGYILESLFEIDRLCGITEPGLEEALRKGLRYYHREQFFDNGVSKWRLPHVWPVEIHNQAQGIITFSRMASFDSGYLPFARQIAQWTLDHMQDARGYFYYRKYAWFMNRIPYMRWSQAWMLLSLTTLCQALQTQEPMLKNAMPEG